MRRLGAAALGVTLGIAAAGWLRPPAALAQQAFEDREAPAAGAQNSEERVAELERRFVRRVSEALHLDEAQARQLATVMKDTRDRRQKLVRQEAALRRELGELVRAERPDDARVNRLLNEMTDVQVRQAEIFRGEQRRLAKFLPPVDRARFLYLRQRLAQAAQGGARRRARPSAKRRPTDVRPSDRQRRPALRERGGAAGRRAPTRRPRRRPR